MKNFLLATRPKTLVAAIIPPLMSYKLAKELNIQTDVYLVICCILSALCIQLATNFFNDLIDFQKGADVIRHGPLRVTSAGLVPQGKIRSWAFASLLFASVFAIPLILKAGSWILFPGLLSLYLSYGYTGGPLPLAYKGLGELFVFIFFGLFSVVGSFYIYTEKLNLDVLILACIYGLMTMTLICVNNLRDREEDAKVKKMTLATRMSQQSYRFLTIVTIFLPYLLAFTLNTLTTYWTLLLSLPLGLKLASIVYFKSKEHLNEGLKFAGIHLIIFSLTLNFSF